MDGYPIISISSLQDLLGVLQTLKENLTYKIEDKASFFKERIICPDLYYRGQPNVDYPLMPGLFRERKLDNTKSVGAFPRSLEKIIIEEFISEGCIYKSTVSRDDYLTWIEIAQHHGLPTRLLDFTSNPLVALFFACIDEPDKDAYLWVINNEAYKRYVVLKNDNSCKDKTDEIRKIVNDEIINRFPDLHRLDLGFIQFPRIYKPSYYDERMVAQSSVFMIWAASYFSFDEQVGDPRFWINDNKKNKDGVIGRILIPKACKKDMLEQLDIAGINEKSIYKGLDGVGKYLCQKYKNDGEGANINPDYQKVSSGSSSITLNKV